MESGRARKGGWIERRRNEIANGTRLTTGAQPGNRQQICIYYESTTRVRNMKREKERECRGEGAERGGRDLGKVWGERCVQGGGWVWPPRGGGGEKELKHANNALAK